MAAPPQDKHGSDLEDLTGTPVELNADGTLTLFHRTSKEEAALIKRDGFAPSRYSRGEAFFSTHPRGAVTGYGETIVVVRVLPRYVELDDAFRDGEVHVSIDGRDLRHVQVEAGPQMQGLSDGGIPRRGSDFDIGTPIRGPKSAAAQMLARWVDRRARARTVFALNYQGRVRTDRESAPVESEWRWLLEPGYLEPLLREIKRLGITVQGDEDKRFPTLLYERVAQTHGVPRWQVIGKVKEPGFRGSRRRQFGGEPGEISLTISVKNVPPTWRYQRALENYVGKHESLDPGWLAQRKRVYIVGNLKTLAQDYPVPYRPAGVHEESITFPDNLGVITVSPLSVTPAPCSYYSITASQMTGAASLDTPRAPVIEMVRTSEPMGSTQALLADALLEVL